MLGLGPRRVGIAPDINSGENAPPSNFLAAVERRIPLTPLPASQRHHASIRAAQTPGGPLLSFVPAPLRPSPDLDANTLRRVSFQSRAR